MANNAKKLQQFPEGTFFSVPLEDGRFAVGIIARRSPKKGKYSGHFGYYWGPYKDINSCIAELKKLTADNALIRFNCGGLYLHSGRWKVLGQKQPWFRSEWPFPDFYQNAPGTNVYHRVRYDEDDIHRAIFHERISDSQGLDEDGVSGALFAEIHLSRAMGAGKDKKIN
jgi:Immunity protein 26